MLIGELAELAGTSARTLRYYEEQGLVHPQRDAHGYRQYDDAELRVVHEIRSLLAVGFGMDDIKPFVECLRTTGSAHVCPDSVAVLRRKLAEVDGLIEELTDVRLRLHTQLTQALAHRETTCSSPSPTPPSTRSC